MLHVRNFTEPSFDEQMIDNSLVMDEQRKTTLKALAKSFARQNKHSELVTRDWWSADFVKGKGSGLIFLLHGSPGTGKVSAMIFSRGIFQIVNHTQDLYC